MSRNATENEIKFYEAGVKDANEARCITVACRSERVKKLLEELKLTNELSSCLASYNSGVAFEICRQTRLEF